MTVPKINSAHGSDTRNIINRAIEVLNHLGVDVQTLVAEGQLTEDQYANLIKEVNGLIAKGEVTVSDIDKNKGKFDQTYLTDELLQQIAGTAEINATPADNSLTTEKFVDKSVTIEKTNFIKVSSDNLLNKEDYLPNSRLSASGNINSYSNGHLLHFVPVKPSSEYTLHRIYQYGYYDHNRTFMSLNDTQTTTDVVTTPENAHYIRPIIFTTQMDMAQINEGVELLPYDEYAVNLVGASPLDDFLTTDGQQWEVV